MFKFYKTSDNNRVADFIAVKIGAALSNKKTVLWLVPGGSAIGITAEVCKRLTNQELDFSLLNVSQTDERYGQVGHEDSNWQQLIQAGFDLPGAKALPILTGADDAQTVLDYADKLAELLDSCQCKLGFFGIGADGHTAGILPDSLAVNGSMMAVGYEAANYYRITMTPSAISKLDEAVVYAVGEAKWPVLDQLEQDISLNQQPAQVLKSVPVVTIFNDYKGDIL